MAALGWKAVFWLFGVIGVLLGILWFKFVPDNPKQSPYVNEAELEHINDGRENTVEAKEIAPWGKLLKSSQFWSLGLQFMITDYIMYVFQHGFALFNWKYMVFPFLKWGCGLLLRGFP